MKLNRKHTWLFSFTDVAFLLLLVYTQYGRLNAEAPVAEMRLPAPEVTKNSELLARRKDTSYCQVLVDRHSETPYRVVRIEGGKETAMSEPMGFEALQVTLAGSVASNRSEPRPVVVPLPESFSSDLLKAAAVVSKLWNEEGTAVVRMERQEGTQRSRES